MHPARIQPFGTSPLTAVGNSRKHAKLLSVSSKWAREQASRHHLLPAGPEGLPQCLVAKEGQPFGSLNQWESAAPCLLPYSLFPSSTFLSLSDFVP